MAIINKIKIKCNCLYQTCLSGARGSKQLPIEHGASEDKNNVSQQWMPRMEGSQRGLSTISFIGFKQWNTNREELPKRWTRNSLKFTISPNVWGEGMAWRKTFSEGKLLVCGEDMNFLSQKAHSNVLFLSFIAQASQKKNTTEEDSLTNNLFPASFTWNFAQMILWEKSQRMKGVRMSPAIAVEVLWKTKNWFRWQWQQNVQKTHSEHYWDGLFSQLFRLSMSMGLRMSCEIVQIDKDVHKLSKKFSIQISLLRNDDSRCYPNSCIFFSFTSYHNSQWRHSWMKLAWEISSYKILRHRPSWKLSIRKLHLMFPPR